MTMKQQGNEMLIKDSTLFNTLPKIVTCKYHFLTLFL